MASTISDYNIISVELTNSNGGTTRVYPDTTTAGKSVSLSAYIYALQDYQFTHISKIYYKYKVTTDTSSTTTKTLSDSLSQSGSVANDRITKMTATVACNSNGKGSSTFTVSGLDSITVVSCTSTSDSSTGTAVATISSDNKKFTVEVYGDANTSYDVSMHLNYTRSLPKTYTFTVPSTTTSYSVSVDNENIYVKSYSKSGNTVTVVIDYVWLFSSTTFSYNVTVDYTYTETTTTEGTTSSSWQNGSVTTTGSSNGKTGYATQNQKSYILDAYSTDSTFYAKITVYTVSLSSISLGNNISPTQYNAGEKFYGLTSGTITAKYTDGTTYTGLSVSNLTYSITNGTELTSTYSIVYAYYGDLSTSYSIIVVDTSSGEDEEEETTDTTKTTTAKYIYSRRKYVLRKYNASSAYVTGFKPTDLGYEKDEDAPDMYYIVPSGLDNSSTNYELKGKAIGYMLMGNPKTTSTDSNNKTTTIASTNARIVLFNNFANLTAGGYGNATIKFPHYVEGYADRINQCTIGKIYNNQLFVSGNEDYKNFDWHTTNPSVDDEDDSESTKANLTYFSDLDYCEYGTKNTPVVGYDIYSDGDLIVFKGESTTEPTMYFRTLQYVTATNSSGITVTDTNGDTLTEESYPRYVLNQGGEGALSSDLICNYLGDTVVGTKTGLKVLTTKSISSNNHTNLTDVSILVNPMIEDEDYANAKLFTYDRRMLLQTNRGLYIAEKDCSSNSQYEYFFQALNAKSFIYINNTLYFIRNDGTDDILCKVSDEDKSGGRSDKDDYGDRYDYQIISATNSSGLITPKEGYENTVAIDDIYMSKLSEGTYLNMDDVQTRFCRKIVHSSSLTLVDEPKYLQLYQALSKKFYISDDDGKTFYAFSVTETSLGESFTITLLKNGESYKTYDWKADVTFIVPIYGSGFYKVNELVYDDSNTLIGFTIADTQGNIVVPTIISNSEYDLLTKIQFLHRVPIEAFYLTKPYAFGNMNYLKTIRSITIANDVALNSSFDVKLLTNNKSNWEGTKSNKENTNNSQLTFAGFSLGGCKFSYDEMPHVFTYRRTYPRASFAKFKFTNDTAKNMVLSQLYVGYILNQPNMKGEN